MSDIVCYESDGSILQYYTQWDVNQTLVIKGADTSSAPNFNFSNALIDDAYVIKSTISDGGLVASVPDEILQYSVSIIVHIQYRTGETEYEIRIPVMPRKKPDNYIYTDTETGGASGGQVSIANNLTTNDPLKALSAAQGVVIRSRLDNIDTSISDIENIIDELEKNGGSIDVADQINAALQEAMDSGRFDGRGILSIEKTSGTGAAGTSDVYTITFTDNTTFAFTVYNGANGASGGGSGGRAGFVVQNTTPEDTSVLWVDPDDNSDDGFLEAVDTALAMAKESGEFDGDDYILTYADKAEIAEMVADLVDMPDPPESGGVGRDGATFTPHVDSDGNLSWTNNGGLSNPETVNIKGYTPRREIDYWTEDDKNEIKSYVDNAILEGDENSFSPIITITDIDRGHIITITDINGTQSFTVLDGEDGHTPGFTIGQVTTLSAGSMATATITGTKENPVLNLGIPKGRDGSNGTNGEYGATFTPYVNSSGVISWTNDKDLPNPQAVNIKGPVGDDGVGIASIKQTTTSTADSGTNVITATLSNGQESSFNIKNGSKGSNATINGVNTLTLDTGAGIDKVQSGSTLTISGNLTNMLASGPIILKEGLDFHYGDTLPPAGNRGRLFFKKKVAE